MKKLFILLAILSLLPLSVYAFSHLTINWRNGEKLSIALSELSDISFDGNNVVFTYKTGNIDAYAYTDISNLRFSNQSGLSSISEQTGRLTVSPNPTKGICRVYGLETNQTVYELYALDGHLVSQGLIGENGEINMTAFHQGLYVLIVNGQNFKIEKQ